ncbi:MAG: hypothetical protein ABEJ89_04040 [Haloarculaceae archaeon]
MNPSSRGCRRTVGSLLLFAVFLGGALFGIVRRSGASGHPQGGAATGSLPVLVPAAAGLLIVATAAYCYRAA